LKKYNVLIFPAGSEIGLEILNSLKYNLHFNVYGASGMEDHAKLVYPKECYFEGDLYINEPSFINNFNEVINRFNIDYIFPTHDSIALYLSEHRKEINAELICTTVETARIARSKKKMYETLKEFAFTPKTYNIEDYISEFPVFLKPDIGEGGKHTIIAKNKYEIEEAINKKPDLIICEYLPGKEYTVDCFTDRNGELLFIGPRTRNRITMGISFHSERIALNEEIIDIAQKLNSFFTFRGSWFFQVKEDGNGKQKLMEFAVRQSSTMGLYRQLGVNFALLSLFDYMGYDVKVLFNDYHLVLDRCLHNSYCLSYEYNKLYIDFDDTLIVNGKVNTTLMKLIYQNINANKQVILLTKHAYDLDESLKKYRINKELFDEIILIDPNKMKADYIDRSKAVFIDNYFPERLSVKEVCNIPVFDVDAVECLLDSRGI
jgi:predicted ATP-grasp superfamily ATP-dependent carboligase